MTTELYQRLARHLDDLPGGFPATESGVELRILRRLFTPPQAELALQLSLIPEPARVIARRAGITADEAQERLSEMAARGLILSQQRDGRSRTYQASQYVVGIWEFQVSRLTPELVEDMEEYLPSLFDADDWRRVPQVRTIPVAESVPAGLEVMVYEQARELVRAHGHVAVAPCICRQERTLVGEGCDRPQETCLSFGDPSGFMVHHGLAHPIDQAEALDILALADEAALVLQPSNSRQASFICCCCGCCCGILRQLRRAPQPAKLASTPFGATLAADACRGCGVCVNRCQMGAIHLEEGRAVLDADRCIGCGLCVTTCPTHALELARKPPAHQARVPPSYELALLQLARLRGKLGPRTLAQMVARSGLDRLRALR